MDREAMRYANEFVEIALKLLSTAANCSRDAEIADKLASARAFLRSLYGANNPEIMARVGKYLLEFSDPIMSEDMAFFSKFDFQAFADVIATNERGARHIDGMRDMRERFFNSTNAEQRRAILVMMRDMLVIYARAGICCC